MNKLTLGEDILYKNCTDQYSILLLFYIQFLSNFFNNKIRNMLVKWQPNIYLFLLTGIYNQNHPNERISNSQIRSPITSSSIPTYSTLSSNFQKILNFKRSWRERESANGNAPSLSARIADWPKDRIPEFRR